MVLITFAYLFHNLEDEKDIEDEKIIIKKKVKKTKKKQYRDEWDHFIAEHSIKFTPIEFRTLLEGSKDVNQYPELFLKIVQNRMTKSSYGINAEQAGELLAQYNQQGYDYRWWHIIGGLVFDRWNLDDEIHGIASCYYGSYLRPKQIKDVQKCVWLLGSENGKKFDNLFISNIPYDIRQELLNSAE